MTDKEMAAAGVQIMAERVKEMLAPGVGYFLMVFNYGENPLVAWSSSVSLADSLKLMQAAVDAADGTPNPPSDPA